MGRAHQRDMVRLWLYGDPPVYYHTMPGAVCDSCDKPFEEGQIILFSVEAWHPYFETNAYCNRCSKKECASRTGGYLYPALHTNMILEDAIPVLPDPRIPVKNSNITVMDAVHYYQGGRDDDRRHHSLNPNQSIQYDQKPLLRSASSAGLGLADLREGKRSRPQVDYLEFRKIVEAKPEEGLLEDGSVRRELLEDTRDDDARRPLL